MAAVLPVDEVASMLTMKIPVVAHRVVGFSSDSSLISLADFLSLYEGQHHHDSLRIKPQITDQQINQLGMLTQKPFTI